VATIKSRDRGIGFNFRLKTALKIDTARLHIRLPSCFSNFSLNCNYITRLQTFHFIINNETFSGKLLINVGEPPKLGELVIVQAQRTGFHLTEAQIAKWLTHFGNIEGFHSHIYFALILSFFLLSLITSGEVKYRDNQELPGVEDDTLEVLMRLKRHIPSVLPAFGRKLNIRYRGQPIQCSKCLQSGHLRKTCPNNFNNWVGYVKSFVDSGVFTRDLFGKWIEHLNAIPNS